jgi:DNA helicase HerA-like ATPase
LFNGNCVINLSKIANAKDKALIMSVILIALYEYRKSVFAHDAEYREHAKQNELMHLTVIEEAHNVLARPSAAAENSGNPQQVVADLFANMLAEIRSMGEGLMIIDQVPTKLIPDVIKNTNYKICHRITSMDDSNVMATALALRDDQKGLIPSLEPGNAIISGDRDDAASWVKIYKNK